MDISTKHENAVIAACRIPALQARLALLDANSVNAQIDFYPAGAWSTPGDTPSESVVASIPLAATAGTVDTDLFRIQLTVPIEAQVDGADPVNGTEVALARVLDGDGDWWADLTVSDEAGSGEIKLIETLLLNGEYARLASAVVQG